VKEGEMDSPVFFERIVYLLLARYLRGIFAVALRKHVPGPL
jgi:hypothetical protein